MKSIEKIDKNFVSASVIEQDDVVWYNIRQNPFKIYGLHNPTAEGFFRRIPTEVAKNCEQGVRDLYSCTAGGRVRFKTDSPYLALKVFIPGIGGMSHMAFSGIAGFDLYEQKDKNYIFLGGFRPGVNCNTTEYDGKVNLWGGMRDLVLAFPLYNAVSDVYIGIKRGSALVAGEEYSITKPIVFYGSSITQGGCASRPSTSYQAHISHRFDADFINLGFSGSAKGEKAMAEYVAQLDMSAFVLDYDYNAPSIEHLEKTHLPFFNAVLEANPDLPIIIVSRPTPSDRKRFEIIKATYDYAIAQGDTKVKLIDGDTLFGGEFDYCTVDGCHPNDLGFYKMGKVIGDALSEYFE